MLILDTLAPRPRPEPGASAWSRGAASAMWVWFWGWRSRAWPAPAGTGTSCWRCARCSTRSSGTPTASTSPHLDTPTRLTTARPEQITVTDPTHPLFGRCFALASVTGSAARGHALVVDHGEIRLKLPIGATSLAPAPPPVSSKLSLGAIRDLIRLASQVAQTRRSASGGDPGVERAEGDPEPVSAASRRSPGGEP